MDRGGGGKAGLVGSVPLLSPQPWENVTYLGAHRLEARQGADHHTLVIHAAALGTGQHVHETVHLGCRAALCVEQRPRGGPQALGNPAHPSTPPHPKTLPYVLTPRPTGISLPTLPTQFLTLSTGPPNGPLSRYLGFSSSFFFFFFFFFVFLGPHPRPMEIPRLGVESEL